MMNANDHDLYHLETKRLLLRPFTEADYPLVLRISSDPETTRYLYYWGRIGTTPESDARRFLKYALTSWAEKPIRAREFCVTLRESGLSIGDGSVEWVADQPGTAEIGWILLPEYRKQGYALEMGKELLREAFLRMNACQVIAHCDARNGPSYRLMQRLGMRLIHTEPEARPAKHSGEKNGDEYTCRILKSEWRDEA